MKKGFTLIELLAVIVVIAILSLITAPSLRRVVEKTKIGAVRDSAYGLIEAADLYYAVKSKSTFVCNGVSCVNDYNEKLNFKGSVPLSGKIIADKKSSVEYIKINNYCVLGSRSYLDVKDSCSKLDITESSLELTNSFITSKKIAISVNSIDNESGIKKIIYQIDNKKITDTYNQPSSVNIVKEFDDLEAGKEYDIIVTSVNGSDLETTKHISIKTLNLGVLTVKFKNIPNVIHNGYYYNQEAYLDYDSNDAKGFYIKTLRNAKSNITSQKECGNNNSPESCINIATVNLLAGKWYYFNSSPRITYDVTDNTESVLYARVTNGVSITSNSTGTISKIDQTNPVLVLDDAVVTSKSVEIPFTTEDLESGISQITCKYSTSQNSYTYDASISNNKCIINNLNHNTTYYYQVCSEDLVGNIKCESENSKTLALSVSLKVTNTPSSSIDGYYKKQVWNFDTTGNPTVYYVKSTSAATSSVNLTQSCGTDTNPGTCSTITSTKSMAANTWYYTTSKPSITFENTNNEIATLYARISDGKNTTANASAVVSKIDASGPELELSNATVTSKSISIPITTSDEHSGLDTITCKYSTTSGSYTTDASLTNNNCTINNANHNTTYYYQVCSKDLLGNITCKEDNSKTLNLSVTLKVTNTPSSSVGGYFTEQIWNLDTTGNPTVYYVKSTREATSSVNLTQSCGTDTNPGTCSTITSTKSMAANTWYYTASKPAISYNSYADSTATLYARITDGKNTTSNASATVSKIGTAYSVILDNNGTKTTNYVVKEKNNPKTTFTISTNGKTNVSCNNGAVPSLSGTTLTISNVDKNVTCYLNDTLSLAVSHLDTTQNTILMINNEAITGTITIGTDKKVNLYNDYNIKYDTSNSDNSVCPMFKNYGTFTINGKGNLNSNYRILMNYNKLTINGGSFTSYKPEVSVSGGGIISTENDATTIINDGYFEGDCGYILYTYGNGNLTINSAIVNSTTPAVVSMSGNSPIININGGTFITSGNYNTFINSSNSIFTINQDKKAIYISSNAAAWKPVILNNSTGTINITANQANKCTANSSDTTTGLCVYGYNDQVTTSSGNGALQNVSSGVVNIKGGTFYGQRQGINNNADGLINMSEMNVVSDGIAVLNNNAGTINICSGIVNGINNDLYNSRQGYINYTPQVTLVHNKITNPSGSVTSSSTCQTTISENKILSLSLTSENTPIVAQNGYLKTQVWNLTTTGNPTGYWIKSTKAAESSVNLSKICGTGTNPGTCTDITATKNIAANTWYYTTSKPSITYSTLATSTGVLYAKTTDGTNTTATASATVSKIDTTSPTVTLETPTVTSKSISIPVTSSDAHSGLNTVTCKYSTTSGTYTTDASSISTSNCTISNITHNTTYYYQVCVSDKVGNTATCKTGSSKTSALTVTLKSTNTPSSLQNGYLKNQVWSLETVGNPTVYYVKSTSAATSSVNLTKSCGTDTNPGACTDITATKNIAANTWYYTTSKPSITYNKQNTASATLYARITDGKNTTSNASATVSKIDTTSPTVSLSETTVGYNSISIPITSSDNHSGVGTVTCKYSTTNGSYVTSASSVSSTNCTLNSLEHSTTYYYQVCVSDKVGNTATCKTGSSKTSEPVATVGNKGYASITSAINSASSGTVKVLKDVTECSITIAATKNWTIDLNEKTVTCSTSGKAVFVVSGIAAIGGNGTITSSQNGIYVKDSGTLTYNNGTINATEFPIHQVSSGSVTINDGTLNGGANGLMHKGTGTMTINGGTVNGTNYNGISIQGAGNLVINGGTITGNTYQGVDVQSGIVKIFGGTIRGKIHGIYSAGTLHMCGGNVASKTSNYACVYTGGGSYSSLNGQWTCASGGVTNVSTQGIQSACGNVEYAISGGSKKIQNCSESDGWSCRWPVSASATDTLTVNSSAFKSGINSFIVYPISHGLPGNGDASGGNYENRITSWSVMSNGVNITSKVTKTWTGKGWQFNISNLSASERANASLTLSLSAYSNYDGNDCPELGHKHTFCATANIDFQRYVIVSS